MNTQVYDQMCEFSYVLEIFGVKSINALQIITVFMCRHDHDKCFQLLFSAVEI